MAALRIAPVTVRSRAHFAAMVAWLVVSTQIAAAQALPRSEYEIKAAYLFSFGKFVEWPPQESDDPSRFTICVLGVDPFGAVLDRTVAGATIHGHAVSVRRVISVDEAAGCHIVFVSGSEERSAGAIVETLRRTAALTVSDMPQFASRGGMIEFVTAANRVRFQINVEPARSAGLSVSSELLRVASTVLNGGKETR